jgi:molybdate transport system substrate-binding protein
VIRLAAVFAAVTLGSIGTPDGTLTVSAAVSLTDVMGAMAGAYSSAGGSRLVFNFGASNVLARQIVNGAPVDIFISADEAQMNLISGAGMVEPGFCAPIASNQLAIVVRRDWKGQLPSAAALTQPDVRRIAVGDPAAVPAGVYAKQYLERLGLWPALQAKLLPAASVRGALAAVENGAADTGIVYATDVQRAAGLRAALVVSGSEAPRIVYPACVIRGSVRGAAARSFLKFLTSPEAARVFREYGFRPVADGR